MLEFLTPIAVVGGFVAGLVCVGFITRAIARACSLLRVLRTPHRWTRQVANLASDADAAETVELYGKVIHDGLVRSPLSGTECLAYRFEVTGREDDARASDGSHELHSEYAGVRFSINDGSGAVPVDLCRGRVHADWRTVEMNQVYPFNTVSDGEAESPLAIFDQYTLDFTTLPASIRGWNGVRSVNLVEKVLLPAEKLYVCGTATEGALRDGDYQGIIVRHQTPAQVKKYHALGVLFESAAAVVSGMFSWGLWAFANAFGLPP